MDLSVGGLYGGCVAEHAAIFFLPRGTGRRRASSLFPVSCWLVGLGAGLAAGGNKAALTASSTGQLAG